MVTGTITNHEQCKCGSGRRLDRLRRPVERPLVGAPGNRLRSEYAMHDSCGRSEERILEALTHVPGATVDQVRRIVTDEEVPRILGSLVQKRIVDRRRFQVRRVNVDEGPLIELVDKPLDAQAAGALAHLIRHRYGRAEIDDVYSLGPFRRPLQVDHELGVTEVYIWYRINHPSWPWRPENPRRGAHVPDGIVTRPDGAEIAIDFAGEYRAPKLLRLSQTYASSRMSLELW